MVRLELKKVNSGPFTMFQVLDYKYKPPRCLKTFSDEDEAKDYINKEVENNQWLALNRD